MKGNKLDKNCKKVKLLEKEYLALGDTKFIYQ